MRVHTNTPSLPIYSATMTAEENCSGFGQVFVESTKHGSRSHRFAFEIRLTGDGSRNRRRTMDNTDFSCTYDQWGWYLAHLFAVDATMKAGPYTSAEDFHTKTMSAYRLSSAELAEVHAAARLAADNFAAAVSRPSYAG